MKQLILFCIGFMTLLSAESIHNKPWVILFLDIDGVLFNEAFENDFEDRKRAKLHELFGNLSDLDSFHWDCATAYFLEPATVALLENFIDRTCLQYNVGIVLSSSWREGRTLAEIHQMFFPWRFSQFIIDKTPDDNGLPSHTRAKQIKEWLRIHADMEIYQFIILDDDDFQLAKKFPHHFVHVRSGLLKESDIADAFQLLTKSIDYDSLLLRLK